MRKKKPITGFFCNGVDLNFANASQSIAPLADVDGQLNTTEGCATISDINGNLLFYTDGSTVWEKILEDGIGKLDIILNTKITTQMVWESYLAITIKKFMEVHDIER